MDKSATRPRAPSVDYTMVTMKSKNLALGWRNRSTGGPQRSSSRDYQSVPRGFDPLIPGRDRRAPLSPNEAVEFTYWIAGTLMYYYYYFPDLFHHYYVNVEKAYMGMGSGPGAVQGPRVLPSGDAPLYQEIEELPPYDGPEPLFNEDGSLIPNAVMINGTVYFSQNQEKAMLREIGVQVGPPSFWRSEREVQCSGQEIAQDMTAANLTEGGGTADLPPWCVPTAMFSSPQGRFLNQIAKPPRLKDRRSLPNGQRSDGTVTALLPYRDSPRPGGSVSKPYPPTTLSWNSPTLIPIGGDATSAASGQQRQQGTASAATGGATGVLSIPPPPKLLMGEKSDVPRRSPGKMLKTIATPNKTGVASNIRPGPVGKGPVTPGAANSGSKGTADESPNKGGGGKKPEEGEANRDHSGPNNRLSASTQTGLAGMAPQQVPADNKTQELADEKVQAGKGVLSGAGQGKELGWKGSHFPAAGGATGGQRSVVKSLGFAGGSTPSDGEDAGQEKTRYTSSSARCGGHNSHQGLTTLSGRSAPVRHPGGFSQSRDRREFGGSNFWTQANGRNGDTSVVGLRSMGSGSEQETLIRESIAFQPRFFSIEECQKIEDRVRDLVRAGENGELMVCTYEHSNTRKRYFFGEGFGSHNGKERLVPSGHVDPIPAWVLDLILRPLAKGGILSSNYWPNAINVNLYEGGSYVPPHLDSVNLFE
ncbi:unnamed protein product, partial [Cyprideis torosa]